MRKLTYFVVGVCIVIILFMVGARPLIITLTKRQLASVFKGSSVTVGQCKLDPFRFLSLKTLSIKHPSSYKITVDEIRVLFSLPALSKGTLPDIVLIKPKVAITTPKQDIGTFVSTHLKLESKGAVLIKRIIIEDLDLSVSAKDIQLQSGGSLSAHLISQRLESLAMYITSAQGKDYNVSGARCSITQGNEGGKLVIKEVKVNKLKVSNIISSVYLQGQTLSFRDFSAELLNGKMFGQAQIMVNPDTSFSVELSVKDIDLAALARDFEFDNKVSLSGLMEGSSTARGALLGLQQLEGHFTTAGEGGELSVKDESYVHAIAKVEDVPAAILMESLKNYRYNKGSMMVGFDKGVIFLDIVFDGLAGKRTFYIKLHDFLTSGGGR